MSEVRGAKTKKIFDAIKAAGKPVSLKELREITGEGYNTVRGAVRRLLKAGLIVREKKGVYKVKE
ncbi:MAG: DNA-binding protein [Candidatus Geothermarchaeota archaeon]